jgi:hypothetical protein
VLAGRKEKIPEPMLVAKLLDKLFSVRFADIKKEAEKAFSILATEPNNSKLTHKIAELAPTRAKAVLLKIIDKKHCDHDSYEYM